MLEQQILKSILHYLNLRNYLYWRNNSGGMPIINKKGVRHFIRFGSKGSPDIFVVHQSKIYGIEVKTREGKQSDDQKIWQIKFEQAGGIYLLVRSLSEVVSVLP